MANSTGTDIIFEGAWSNRKVGKQENCHSTDAADKRRNVTPNHALPYSSKNLVITLHK